MRTVPRITPRGAHNPRMMPAEYEPAMTFAEIAAALGCSPQSVWMTYARAMDKIRSELRRRPEQYAAILSGDIEKNTKGEK